MLVWGRIYSGLPGAEAVRGLAVCRAFRQELPIYITSIEAGPACIESAEQVAALASNFPHLKHLKLHVRTPFPDNSERYLAPATPFAALEELEVESDEWGALNISLRRSSFPRLKTYRIKGCICTRRCACRCHLRRFATSVNWR